MPPSNVLIVTNNYPTELKKRAGVFARQDFDYFTSNGAAVDLLVLSRYYIHPKDFLDKDLPKHVKALQSLQHTLASNTRIEIVRYFSLPKPYVQYEHFFLRLKTGALKQHYDLVLFEFMVEPGLLAKIIRKKISASRFVLREHSDWRLYHPLMKKACARNLHFFDKIVANSRYMKDAILQVAGAEHVNLQADKIAVNYPKFNVNTRFFAKSNTQLQFLTVANLIEAKGFGEATTILANLKKQGLDFRWVIIGKGPCKSSIEATAREKEIWESITFVDELPQEELPHFYINADVYIQLSYFETFGIAPIEAYSYGCKLIISDKIPSVSELIEDQANIFLLPAKSGICDTTLLHNFVNAPFLPDHYQTNVDRIKREVDAFNF